MTNDNLLHIAEVLPLVLAAMVPICSRRRWDFLFYSTAAAFAVFIAAAVALKMIE